MTSSPENALPSSQGDKTVKEWVPISGSHSCKALWTYGVIWPINTCLDMFIFIYMMIYRIHSGDLDNPLYIHTWSCSHCRDKRHHSDKVNCCIRLCLQNKYPLYKWLVFKPRFCTVRLCWAGKTWANEMNFVMNHAPGAGSNAQPADQQSSALPLSYGCPQISITFVKTNGDSNITFQLYKSVKVLMNLH